MGFTTLPLASGGINGAAYGISADGHIIVGYTDLGSTTRAACYWTNGAGPTVIGANFSEAYGVSSNGSVISGSTDNMPFRWTSAGMVSFGAPNDLVYAMSADASRMVGSRQVFISSTGRNEEEATAWNAAGTATLLGHLSGDDISRALGVSADGSVIVGYSALHSTGVQRAFRWTAAGGMVDLGLTGSATGARAFGVSADGSVVVGGLNGPGGSAFRWTAAGGMEALSTLIIATGISGDGSTIIASAHISDPDFSSSYLGYMTATEGTVVPTPVALDPAQPTVTQGTYPDGVSADGMTMVGYSYGTNPLPWLYTVAPPEPPGQKPKLWLLRQPELHFIGVAP